MLRSNYHNFEIILVDNASTDGSFKIAKKRFSNSGRIKFLSNERDVGFTEANNIGLRTSDLFAEYIIFLNIDTKVDPMWLRNLVLICERNREALLRANACSSITRQELILLEEYSILCVFHTYRVITMKVASLVK